MILFQLGREYKLSVAELVSVFPALNIIYVSREVLIADGLQIEEVIKKADSLGGVIKIAGMVSGSLLDEAEKNEGKFQYALSLLAGKGDLKKILMQQKKELKTAGISSRFVNKDFQNVSSAQIIGERLIKKGTDFSIVNDAGVINFFKSLWVQDIDAYSDRDYSKSRDMQVGMLPPKLSQMLINLSGGDIVYDPFVGLGSLLIESIYMGKKEVYGSDLSETMVETSAKNLEDLKRKQKNFEYRIEKLNAKFIHESQYLAKADTIVTEGYLGEIMTQANISIDRIEKQKQSLEKIYGAFFEGLQKTNFKGTIVICFPFWEMKKNYIFAQNLCQIIEKYCDIIPVIPQKQIPQGKEILLDSTKTGSLLYKRKNQLVGREIYKLTIR